MSPGLVLCLLVTLLTVSCSASAQDTRYVVRLAQVVHRHGAREPLFTADNVAVCGTEYPCSSLNAQGMEMMRVVGDFVRNRYRDPNIVESPLLPTDTYNASLVYSRSTSVSRTLQSASAFLHGLFPSNASFYPVILTEDSVDALKNTLSMPPFFIKLHVDVAGLQTRFNPLVDALFTWEELRHMAHEAHWSSGCANFALRYKCVSDLQDAATVFQVEGRLTDKPYLRAALPRLNLWLTLYNAYLYDYNASDVVQRRQGALGQHLAQTLMNNIRNHLQTPSYQLFEYSTHDTMVISLPIVFGDRRSVTFLPPFGVTFLIELLQNTDDGSYHVRILRGHPEEQGEPGRYSFVQTSFEQHCMYANGTTYIRDVCPLDDFARFVDSTKPTDPAGICVLEDDQVPLLQCPELGDYTTPVPQYCEVYRSLCPATSCPAGYDLNAADLRCYPGAPAAQGAMLRSAP